MIRATRGGRSLSSTLSGSSSVSSMARLVAYLRTPSIIATLGTLLSVNGVAMMWSGGSPRGYLPDNFRMFGRFVFHDVPVVKIFPVAIVVLVAVCALAQWGLHGTVFGRRVFAIGE